VGIFVVGGWARVWVDWVGGGWEVEGMEGSRGVGEFGWECGEGRMTSARGDFTES